MGIFDKLFGKKKKDKDLSDMLDAAGLELEVGFRDEPEDLGFGDEPEDLGFRDEPEDLNEEDYKYNHCFIFYGLNDEAFTAIENQVQNFDGPDHLSLLRSMEGVLMTDLCGQTAGSKKVKEAMKTDDDSVAYVNQRVDQYLEIIKENFDSQIGEDCLELIELEKHYIVENIRCAMKVLDEREIFEKENCVGAMIRLAKYEQEFDRKDERSENTDESN